LTFYGESKCQNELAFPKISAGKKAGLQRASSSLLSPSSP
jgi:hypothetical protein